MDRTTDLTSIIESLGRSDRANEREPNSASDFIFKAAETFFFHFFFIVSYFQS